MATSSQHQVWLVAGCMRSIVELLLGCGAGTMCAASSHMQLRGFSSNVQ